jgi:hypothetical protein
VGGFVCVGVCRFDAVERRGTYCRDDPEFEAILALALLNVDVWFRDPLSWNQLISWPLLMVAGYLVLVGERLSLATSMFVPFLF